MYVFTVIISVFVAKIPRIYVGEYTAKQLHRGRRNQQEQKRRAQAADGSINDV